ncbi:MAG: flavin reductase family protein [Firmicutes bacterium]|jgi:flavin reductase (DIM6/NTAB) family NADH-FMN oxidoreductase RutF|nr:flavin reductase family protein [Bacillota bacterium]
MEDEQVYDRMRRKVLWSIVNGLYLVGSRYEDDCNVMTCSFVTQVATSPKLVGIGVETESKSAELIEKSKAYTLMFLRRDQREIVRKFVKPALCDLGKHEINGYPYEEASVAKAPILKDVLAYVECSVYKELRFDSHIFFIGEVVNVGSNATPAPDGTPAADSRVLEVLRMEDTNMHYGG